MGNKDSRSINRRLFLQATSTAAFMTGIAGNVQASNHQGGDKVARAGFIEAGAEYKTDAVVPINHVDRIGAYEVSPTEELMLLKMSDERLAKPFKNNNIVAAGSRYQPPPLVVSDSPLQQLPAKLNKSLYYTESIPLAERANVPSARVNINRGTVQAHLGNQTRDVESGDKVNIVGEPHQVEVSDNSDSSAGHSGSPKEAEEGGTYDDKSSDSTTRTIEVRPELIVRNHGQLDVYMPDLEGKS